MHLWRMLGASAGSVCELQPLVGWRTRAVVLRHPVAPAVEECVGDAQDGGAGNEYEPNPLPVVSVVAGASPQSVQLCVLTGRS